MSQSRPECATSRCRARRMLSPSQHFDAPPNPIHDRQSVGAKWTVHDDNDDQLVYSVYYRGDGQTRWLLLKSGLSDKFYSFDASLLPDGGYTVKVIASDAPSHSPQEALSAEKESSRFEVDTTPPQIFDLKAAVQGGAVHVQFRAVDSFSPIKRAEYSLDAGDWHFVEPVDQLSDSKTESYDFSLPSRQRHPGRSMLSWSGFMTGTTIWLRRRRLCRGSRRRGLACYRLQSRRQIDDLILQLTDMKPLGG